MSKMMGGMMGNKNSSMGGGMMNMMKMMMGKSKTSGDEAEGEAPWDMCKKMMSNMSEGFEIAKYATPELRSMFEDWLQQIQDEISKYIEETNSTDNEKIAEHFKISNESVNFILTKLAKIGKIKLKVDKKD